ncbi:MAG: 23S rRNA (uracil(1939)-C(5))-methyltransferase RlmD [Gammaproteobacteria bacterium]
MPRRRRRNSKPVSSIPVSAHITALSHDGRGIASIQGKTTFVEGALPGETVLFKYLRHHGRFDEGQVTEIQIASPERVEPKCPHFFACGGCSLQHMSPDAQIRMKEKMLLEHLQHFGGLKAEVILPPLTGPVWGYRAKARLGVRFVHKKNALLVGFREKNGRYLADLSRCEVLHPKIGSLISELKKLITGLEGYQYIPQIEVALNTLVFRHMAPLSTADQGKIEQFGREHDIQICFQPNGIDSVHPVSVLRYTLPDFAPHPNPPPQRGRELEFLFRPTNFIQINIELNRKMVKHILTLLDPQPTDKILDLFCGLGNFTLPLALYSATVTGIEGDIAMVERAYENARHNNIYNSEFYAANLQQPLHNDPWAHQQFDQILLDPPRTGAFEIIPSLPAMGARRIVYVSCNPATLARDAKLLVELGYRLTHAGIMDMFPHTSHVESVAVFEC